MKFAVITFPGSNCDSDVFHAIKDELGEEVTYVNHKETNLDDFDAILIPGGAAYGDYLRPGAVASLDPIVEEIKKAAEKGKPVVGIGNGFQILLEMDLLPGAVQRNRDQKFICRSLDIVVENNETMFTNGYEKKQNITVPIAHGEGNYYCDEETLQQLKDKQQIVFTYKENVNGSVENIAAIVNEAGNVLGMMPHPERAVDTLLGSEDGLALFTSILNQWRENNAITS